MIPIKETYDVRCVWVFFFFLRICAQKNLKWNISIPTSVLPGHHHPCCLCGRDPARQWSVLQPLLFGYPFTFHPTTHTCQVYLLRMSKHETSSKPSVQMMEPLLRFRFLFQPRLSLKISPFKSEAAARWWLMSDANMPCSIIITVAIRADVSHLFSGAWSQMSVGINAESAHDGHRNPLQKKAL